MNTCRTINDLREGRIPFTADDFPAFTYAEGSFNPDDMLQGLFMHPLPIQVYLIRVVDSN